MLYDQWLVVDRLSSVVLSCSIMTEDAGEMAASGIYVRGYVYVQIGISWMGTVPIGIPTSTHM